MTSLIKATMNNREDIVEILLSYGANPRVANAKGETALSHACCHENISICKRLIVAKADVNHTDLTGISPLAICIKSNKKGDIINLLLENGANPNTCDRNKNSLLHFAAQKGNLEIT